MIPQPNPITDGEVGPIGQKSGSFEDDAIGPHALQRLDQVVLSMATENQRASTEIPPNRQIDLVARKRLPQRNLVAVTHGEAPNAINPKDPGFGHSLLEAVFGNRGCNMAHHNVLHSDWEGFPSRHAANDAKRGQRAQVSLHPNDEMQFAEPADGGANPIS
jgi:hypothetical protein